MIPKDHPRRESLEVRERLVDCFKKGIVVEQGLIAHGRGEAFDYLINEQTNDYALKAIKVASAELLLARKPVISVNGNVACLCAKEVIELAKVSNAKIEINLFYRSKDRINAIKDHLARYGVDEIYGIDEDNLITIEELSSNRRYVDKHGIYSADLVLLALEDGDRTQALVRLKKKVIAIDLNPLSRTAQSADITIVDNVTRALPLMVRYVKEFSRLNKDELASMSNSFDNKANLRNAIEHIRGLRL